MATATATATATTTTTASAPAAAAASPSQLATQLLEHTPAARYDFSFTPFLQQTYQHSLPADRPICKAYAASGHCPQGTRCTERHVSSSSNTREGGGGGGFNSLVCKHWLRGLCKKGESCEFLHEYNLRKMPECNFFVRNGYCSNGDECLYLHVDPLSRLPPCPHYDRGFCALGPRCSKRHLRRRLCPAYLAGFCPDGRACRDGAHPRWRTDLEKATAKDEVAAAAAAAADEAGGPDARPAAGDEEEERDRDRDRMRDRDRDRDRDGRHDRQGHKERFGGRGGGGGGGGGRWRGRGGHNKFGKR